MVKQSRPAAVSGHGADRGRRGIAIAHTSTRSWPNTARSSLPTLPSSATRRCGMPAPPPSPPGCAAVSARRCAFGARGSISIPAAMVRPRANPIHVLCRALSDLHDADGRVRIAGFYDGVSKVPASTLARWRKLGFDGRKFLRQVGLQEPKGRKGLFGPRAVVGEADVPRSTALSAAIRARAARPSFPPRRSAKLTFRLVGRQKPAAVRKAFRRFITERMPADCKATFAGTGGDSGAVELAEDDPLLARAAAALKSEWRCEPARVGSADRYRSWRASSACSA